jgi:hypothetical protein
MRDISFFQAAGTHRSVRAIWPRAIQGWTTKRQYFIRSAGFDVSELFYPELSTSVVVSGGHMMLSSNTVTWVTIWCLLRCLVLYFISLSKAKCCSFCFWHVASVLKIFNKIYLFKKYWKLNYWCSGVACNPHISHRSPGDQKRKPKQSCSCLCEAEKGLPCLQVVKEKTTFEIDVTPLSYLLQPITWTIPFSRPGGGQQRRTKYATIQRFFKKVNG